MPRKLDSLLYMSFGILDMSFGILVYNLYNQLFDCFLCIGMTSAIFRTEGNCPVEKDIKISLNC